MRCRQLEATFPGDPDDGRLADNGESDSLRVGDCAGMNWPESNDAAWPPLEPEGLDRLAKKNRPAPYHEGGTWKIASEGSPLATPPHPFQITERLVPRREGGDSRARAPKRILGSHTVMLLGYDDQARRLSPRMFLGTCMGRSRHRDFVIRPFQEESRRELGPIFPTGHDHHSTESGSRRSQRGPTRSKMSYEIDFDC